MSDIVKYPLSDIPQCWKNNGFPLVVTQYGDAFSCEGREKNAFLEPELDRVCTFFLLHNANV